LGGGGGSNSGTDSGRNAMLRNCNGGSNGSDVFTTGHRAASSVSGCANNGEFLWACDGNVKRNALETWTSKVHECAKLGFVELHSTVWHCVMWLYYRCLYRFQVDVYAIGITLWCMLMCEMPFKVSCETTTSPVNKYSMLPDSSMV
jgi:hypothetical protein